MTQSFRSKVVTRRTYNRPLDEAGNVFESWEQTVDRVIKHQRWLWERELDKELHTMQLRELEELRELMLNRKCSVSGRTLWLGGTNVAKTCEASQFNCSGTAVETVYDVVDTIWLLMQGCGVGFKAVTGQLTGFRKPLEIEVKSSTRFDKGNPNNVEYIRDRVWTIRVGDSAKAWSKAAGKLIIGKHDVDKLVLDFTEIRPSGSRLKGYGWICSGDGQISKAFAAIAHIMNKSSDKLLSKMDILDVENWLGTILSSRRSAQIALVDYRSNEWEEFVNAKNAFWKCNVCDSHNTAGGVCANCGNADTNHHRTQSNNSLLFWEKPSIEQLEDIFSRMEIAGGSEPGFVNAKEATRRAPWFMTLNPCAEILLPNKGFCNLVEINVAAFSRTPSGAADLERALYIMARANYRQTCVNLDDGILQESWHANNDFLRLCGVGLTGIAQRPDIKHYTLRHMRKIATNAAHSMADELGTPRSKNVTTIKPSGTLSKIMDCAEGLHTPLGKYIFNWIGFSIHDPIVTKLIDAGYDSLPKPADDDTILLKLPIEYDGCAFTDVDGTEVNLESAVDQLDRYQMFQQYWTDHNTSVTISYDLSEVQDIIYWLHDNWDSYVGVSFIYRNDPTKTAKDLGYEYLPQEVVTKEVYMAYVATLKEVDLDSVNSYEEIEDEGCAGGACPIK
jgi:adenosylcobalamin-dependent ribonucleoside-triphosphate reductase